METYQIRSNVQSVLKVPPFKSFSFPTPPCSFWLVFPRPYFLKNSTDIMQAFGNAFRKIQICIIVGKTERNNLSLKTYSWFFFSDPQQHLILCYLLSYLVTYLLLTWYVLWYLFRYLLSKVWQIHFQAHKINILIFCVVQSLLIFPFVLF